MEKPQACYYVLPCSPENRMRLRPARISDLPMLRCWDEKPHVIAARGEDGPVDWESELLREVDWSELLVAEYKGRSVGFLQILDPAREESHYWGDIEEGLRAIDVWIGEEGDLGHGLGTHMMRLALARCFTDPHVKAVLLDPLAANTRARRFYERLGFSPVGRRRFGQDDCLVYRLDREAWEQQCRDDTQP
jgi:aminoglycoside 6'-N-acetyltransferase